MVRAFVFPVLCLAIAQPGCAATCPDGHGGGGTATISGAELVGQPGSPFRNPNGTFTCSSFATMQDGEAITCRWTFDSTPPGNWINLDYNHATDAWTYRLVWGSGGAVGAAAIAVSQGTMTGSAGPMIGQGGSPGHHFGMITFSLQSDPGTQIAGSSAPGHPTDGMGNTGTAASDAAAESAGQR